MESRLEHYYICKHIFSLAKLDKLLLGSDILNPKDQDEFIYIGVGMTEMTRDSINENDIFIRSGIFVKLIKTFFFEDKNKMILQNKYLDSNTYSKTLKLGIRLKYNDPTKRNVHYIKLKESLEAILMGLGKVDDALPSQPVLDRNVSGTFSAYTADFSDEYMTNSGNSSHGYTCSSKGNASHRKRRLPQNPVAENTNTLQNIPSVLYYPRCPTSSEGESVEVMESVVDSIEGEICEVVNKLDLLKSLVY